MFKTFLYPPVLRADTFYEKQLQTKTPEEATELLGAMNSLGKFEFCLKRGCIFTKDVPQSLDGKYVSFYGLLDALTDFYSWGSKMAFTKMTFGDINENEYKYMVFENTILPAIPVEQVNTFACRFEQNLKYANPVIEASVSNVVEEATNNPVVSIKNKDETKIYLTGFLHYPNVIRYNKQTKQNETITDGQIQASEPDENGVRWLSLYDVVCMFTGKIRKTVQNEYGKQIDSQIPGVNIVNDLAFVQSGKGRLMATPVIRSTDLTTVGVALNPSFRNLSAATFNRVVGGDQTLHEQIDLNRVIQETLAVEDPTNILRVAGEAVEAQAPELLEAANVLKETIAGVAGEQVHEKASKRLGIMERFNITNDIMKEQKEHDLNAKNRFYLFKIIPKSEEEKAKCKRFGYFIKPGYTTKFHQRFDTFSRLLSHDDYDLELVFVDKNDRSKMVETEMKRRLVANKILPKQKNAIALKVTGSERHKRFSEVFIPTEEFGIDEFINLYNKIKTQVGVPLTSSPRPAPQRNQAETADAFRLAEKRLDVLKEIAFEALKCGNDKAFESVMSRFPQQGL